jgi:hypothetical protein
VIFGLYPSDIRTDGASCGVPDGTDLKRFWGMLILVRVACGRPYIVLREK